MSPGANAISGKEITFKGMDGATARVWYWKIAIYFGQFVKYAKI